MTNYDKNDLLSKSRIATDEEVDELDTFKEIRPAAEKILTIVFIALMFFMLWGVYKIIISFVENVGFMDNSIRGYILLSLAFVPIIGASIFFVLKTQHNNDVTTIGEEYNNMSKKDIIYVYEGMLKYIDKKIIIRRDSDGYKEKDIIYTIETEDGFLFKTRNSNVNTSDKFKIYYFKSNLDVNSEEAIWLCSIKKLYDI